MSESSTTLLDGSAIVRAVSRLAHEIHERNRGVDGLVLVGIRSRGVHLAGRIAAKLKELAGSEVRVGSIDITAYRDDVEQPRERIEVTATDVPLPIANRVGVLGGEVISSGRH